MFKSPEARTALRAGVTAVLTGLGALATALTDGSINAVEVILVASSTIGAGAAWYGIGATTPTEPFLGSNAGLSGKPEVPASEVTTTK